MHMSDMRIRYPNHLTLKAVAEKAHECGLHMTLLLEWGREIKNKFVFDNMKAVVNDGGSLIPFMLERIVILEKNGKLHQEVSRL